MAAPSPEQAIAPIPATRDHALNVQWPLVPADLPMYWSEYPWSEFGVTPLNSPFPHVSPGQVRFLEQEIAKLDQGNDESATRAMHWHFLKADLYQVMARSGGSKEHWINALKSYIAAIKAYPNGSHVIAATYHLGLAYLELRDYQEVIGIAKRQEQRWRNDPQWQAAFRALVMEAYYRRRRFIRAEEYLWDLAREKMGRDEMSAHLALRYGDSLFWQRRFGDAIQWYEQNQHFLEADTQPATQISRLYYAESLFQTARSAEAKVQYDRFLQEYKGKYPIQLVTYRLASCDIESGMPTQLALKKLETAADIDPFSDVGVMAQLAWVRLVIREKVTDFYLQAQLKYRALEVTKLPSAVVDEVLVTGAMLNWRLGESATAVNLLRKFFARITPLTDVLLIRGAADFSALLLAELAPVYFKKEDRLGFLVLCDVFKMAIQRAHTKSYALVWVARAYFEVGMVGAGARLYERILMEVDLTPAQRDRILLELAQAFSRLGEHGLTEKVLAMISAPPDDPLGWHRYHIVRAAHAVAVRRYEECVSEIDQLMVRGIKADELYPVAIQGARCARKIGKFPEALKFIGMVSDEHATVTDTSASQKLQEWTAEALWEKVTILAQMGQHAEVIPLFEQLQAKLKMPPPLETVFLVVESYRRQGDDDRGLEIWKAFGGSDATVPESLRDQYAKLLELLSQTELLPQVSEQ